MSKKKIIRMALVVMGAGVLIAVGIAAYLYYMPHRDVQATKADKAIRASALVSQYLENLEKANQEYLDEEGESKILLVSGEVASISEDFQGAKVVLLKGGQGQAGVSCTFSKEKAGEAAALKKGAQVTIKGVIRSGAKYDADLEMYEHVILDQCGLHRKS